MPPCAYFRHVLIAIVLSLPSPLQEKMSSRLAQTPYITKESRLGIHPLFSSTRTANCGTRFTHKRVHAVNVDMETRNLSHGIVMHRHSHFASACSIMNTELPSSLALSHRRCFPSKNIGSPCVVYLPFLLSSLFSKQGAQGWRARAAAAQGLERRALIVPILGFTCGVLAGLQDPLGCCVCVTLVHCV